MSAMKNIKRRTMRDIIHIYDPETQTEILLVKIEGRGWVKSSGQNPTGKLSLRRLNAWLTEASHPSVFAKVNVSHFHISK